MRSYAEGSRQLLVGTQARLSSWRAGASTARVIQLSGVQAGPGGGFQLGDGVLDLGSIRDTPMQAELVVITAPAPVEVQLARAHAFLDAGAQTVVVEAWPANDANRRRFINSFYEALNQGRTVPRAVEQGRIAVHNDPLAGKGRQGPSVWGSWLLVGRP